MAGGVVLKSIVSKAEDVAEVVYRKINLYLPTVARICLLSTFLEDGLRMVVDFSSCLTWIEDRWKCGSVVSFTIHSILTVSHVFANTMIVMQRRVSIASGILLALIFLKPLAYDDLTYYDFKNLCREITLIGVLLMLLAQNWGQAHTLFAGVPTLENNKHKNYIQLSGRCFILFMFLTMVKYELSLVQILKIVVGTVLLTMVIVGYKTKLSALVLTVLLVIFNFYKNSWWYASGNKREIRKYHFFHGFSVIGGLLLVVLYGPGGISVDETKKKW